MPPVAASVCLYADKSVPAASDVVVTTSGAPIRMVMEAVALCMGCPESVAVILVVTPLGLAIVGVPVICPAVLRLSPAGRDDPAVTLHDSGAVPPVATSVAEEG